MVFSFKSFSKQQATIYLIFSGKSGWSFFFNGIEMSAE
jgi:hypothetical protein